MAMDKVASSPALPTIDGWTPDETPLSENETAALTVALGVGMSVSAATEEPQERHTVADLASLVPDALPTLPPIENVGALPLLANSTSNLRLQTLTEASSEGDSRDSGSEDDPEESPTKKVASFYIGDDQGCTRELNNQTGSLQQLPQGSLQQLPQTGSLQQLPQAVRRVQIQAEQTKLKTVEFTPPDGGYGWVVALAACLVNVWIVGFIKSYGVLYVHVRSAFPEASAYHTSWLPALLSTIGLLIAPLTGTLCRNFTSRKVSFVGGLLCCLGLVLGSQAVSMNQLILSVGVLTGLGAGLTTTPGVLIVSLYFEKRRALASAICVSGNALGGFFLPPLVDYLMEEYGLRGTMLILAAMQLHICAACMLYRPIRLHALIQAEERAKQPKEESEIHAPVPEYNKLLPNTPATPRTNLPSPASAPGTPLNRPHAIWQRMVRNRLNSTTTVEEEELRGEVSFLRSASMMNSIPDLTLYARSWSISGERASMGSRSSIRMALGSKSSLSKLSTAASSKSSLSKLVLSTENKHPPLVRLTSDGSDANQKVARHPTLVRLASEEEGTTQLSRNRSGSIRHSQSRLSMDGRPQLGRQSSVRRVQGRIMTAVIKEQDNDSQISEEMDEEQTPKVCEEEKEKLQDDPSAEEKLQDEKEKEKDIDDDDDEEEEGSESDSPSCLYTLMLSCIDVSLFKNPLFLMVAMSVFFMATGAPHAIFFLPAYAESVDIPSSQVPKMLSISSIVDLVGRLGVGFVSDLGLVRNSYIYFVSGIASSMSVLLVPQLNTFASLSAILGLYGFGIGAWFVLIPTILAQHHGAARLASSYGLARLFHGCMNFISPQVNGILVDSTNSFVPCYYFMGFSMVISAFLMLMEPALVNYTNEKEKKQQMEAMNNNHA
ncbi:uncharacterized protein LOC135195618 [Macrobrachium nipponense]|uniref:uncharacterized protein LOC135195618 n=1 Tax=Macrobrachium nipponense TaxID=159736 RepID=UPI0030C86F10